MDWGKLILSILFCQLAGLLGSIATIPAIPSWYTHLKKPSFSPPNWIFGPVWTVLYTIMGISLYLIWVNGRNNPNLKLALIIFATQLFLNVIWSLLFFGFKKLEIAFGEIIFMWLFILLTILDFGRIDTLAGAILIPYLLWVSFATLLNFKIWKINIT